jgi:signal transduction histidine kinase
MTLRRLRILVFAQVLALIIALEALRYVFQPVLPSWQGRLVMDTAIFFCGLFIVGLTFNVIQRMQAGLELQNRELLALHAAALDIYRELDLEAVLQRTVDRARLLLGARYGAISVIEGGGRITAFVTSGVTPEERARIGSPPQGKGLLGVVLHGGQSLRLRDLGDDPRSAGFPANHPPMRTLIAVPISCTGPFRGNLYLAEKDDAEEFSPADQETLVRFATKAAIAIDHAHLHSRLNQLAVAEERMRIAHEMHDGLAQVLASVNAKALAVREHLRAGHGDEAARQLEQLASAAREVYADVRESITGLRGAATPDWQLARALAQYADTWQEESGIPCEIRIDGDLRLPSATEFQLLRIAQEALTNVRKHAGARRVSLEFRAEGGHAVLRVADDGIGFDPANLGRSESPRFGLATMRERAESIGAEVRMGCVPTGGSEVVVEMPWRQLGVA